MTSRSEGGLGPLTHLLSTVAEVDWFTSRDFSYRFCKVAKP